MPCLHEGHKQTGTDTRFQLVLDILIWLLSIQFYFILTNFNFNLIQSIKFKFLFFIYFIRFSHEFFFNFLSF